MKKFNKFLSGLLSLAMAATCVCTSAFAADYEAVTLDGTQITIDPVPYVGNSDGAAWGKTSVNILTDAVLSGTKVTGTDTGEDKVLAHNGGNNGTFTIPLNVTNTCSYSMKLMRYFNGIGGDTNHLGYVSMKIDDGEYVQLNTSTLTELTDIIPTSTPYGSDGRLKWEVLKNNIKFDTIGSHTITFKADTAGKWCAIGDIVITSVGNERPTDIDPDVPTTIKGATYNGEWSSGTGVVSLGGSAAKAEGGYVLAMPLNVETAGTYRLAFEALMNETTATYWLSNVKFKVNDGTYEKLLTTTNIELVKSQTTGKNVTWTVVALSKYSLKNTLELNEGSNTIYFMVDEERTSGTGCFAAIGDVTVTPTSYVPPATVSASAVTTIPGGTYIGDWYQGTNMTMINQIPYEEGKQFVLEVPLNVEESGEYSLTFEGLMSLITTNDWRSNVNFKVDNGSYEKLLTSTNCTDIGASADGKFLHATLRTIKYKNALNLTAGNHSLYFMVDAQRENNGGYLAAIGDITITPINRPETVSATEATVIKGGTFTVGAQTTTDTNGNTLVGSTGAKSSVTVKLDVEKSGYYKLSFGGAFNDTLSEYHLSKMRFAIDNGRDNADSEVDRTDYLLNGKNVTATTPDSAGTVWGNSVKNYTYNEYVKLTEGEHDLYFVVDDVREHKDGGYMAVLGDITLEPMSDIVLNAATSAVIDGYAKSGSNGTIHANGSTGSQAEFEFEIFEDGWYQINAELMADMTDTEAGTSPINFKLDEAAAYKLTSENTSDKCDLGFGVENWGNYHSYNIGAPVELAKGTHKITFTASEPVTSDNAAVITGIRNVSIKNAENIGIESVEITLPETDVEFNPEENIIGSATIASDGEAVDFDAFTSYSYESSNTDVAVIDAYGEITLTGSGKATITFKASVMGNELSASADLYVYKNGLCVYDITTGTASASAKIKTTSAVTGENVYAAAYASKAMKSAAKFEKNASGVYEISVPVSSGEKAKCFVWGGENGMAPFAGTIELN